MFRLSRFGGLFVRFTENLGHRVAQAFAGPRANGCAGGCGCVFGQGLAVNTCDEYQTCGQYECERAHEFLPDSMLSGWIVGYQPVNTLVLPRKSTAGAPPRAGKLVFARTNCLVCPDGAFREP